MKSFIMFFFLFFGALVFAQYEEATGQQLYDRLLLLWERPMTAEAQVEFKQHLKTLNQSCKLSLNQAPSEIREQINLGRSGLSRTVQGKWENIMGEDSDEVAQKNWSAANDLVAKFVDKKQDLTLERIQEINQIINQNMKTKYPGGELRKPGHDIHAGGQTINRYLEGAFVEKAMKDFLKWYKSAEAKKLSPVVLAAKAHERLISIHPFGDGNGRTMRLVMDWILMRNGYPPFSSEARENTFALAAIFGRRSSEANISPDETARQVFAGIENTQKMLDAAPECQKRASKKKIVEAPPAHSGQK